MPTKIEFAAGTIYYVRDDKLRLPGPDRQMHERRPVLVVSDQTRMHGQNAEPSSKFASVLVVPITSSGARKTQFDWPIEAGDGNITKRGWIRIPALQPIDKDDLEDMLGSVKPDTLKRVTAQILYYLGLIKPP